MITTKKEAFVVNWGNSKCSCIFNTDHNLPCKHLLYLAIAKNKLSDLHLAVRWLKSAPRPILPAAEEEEKENLNEDLDHSDEDSDEDSDEESDDQDIYLESTALFKDMSETLNMMPTAQFQRYMSFLRKVKKNMNEGKLCSLKEGM